MSEEFPLLDRQRLQAFLERNKATLAPVRAAEDGRFILNIPDFGDGKGPVLLPNIKELEARMRGSGGRVKAIELEAGPQEIPADGTNVIVINRTDRYVQKALTARLDDLIDSANGKFTREVLEEFMGYARGYTYDAEKHTVIFTKNAGFHNDVYNMPVSEFKKKYVHYDHPDLSLETIKGDNIQHGYYVKKNLPGHGAYLTGKFSVQVSAGSGTTVQEFQNGAMVHLPEARDLPLSFIHVTDIDTCYTLPDGSPIIDPDGKNNLPHFDAADTQQTDSAANPGKKIAVSPNLPRRRP